MKKKLPRLAIPAAALTVTLIVVLLTRRPFGGVFLRSIRSCVLVFCVSMALDMLYWLLRPSSRKYTSRSKIKDTCWTAACVACILFFLRLRWAYCSLWHVWLVAAVCAVLALGLFFRLRSGQNAGRIRLGTYTCCCLLVTLSITGSLLILRPTLASEAEALVNSSGTGVYALRYIYPSHSAKEPLGFYMFYRTEDDGSWSSEGKGRAIVYLGDGDGGWREPKAQELNK